MILNHRTIEIPSMHSMFLGGIIVVCFVLSLVAILVKCACCQRRRKRADAHQANPILYTTSNTQASELCPQAIEVAPEKNSQPVPDAIPSPSQNKSVPLTKASVNAKSDTEQARKIMAADDSVVHGRSPSQINAAYKFEKSEKHVVVLSEIEHTPKCQRAPEAMPSLGAPPSLAPPSETHHSVSVTAGSISKMTPPSIPSPVSRTQSPSLKTVQSVGKANAPTAPREAPRPIGQSKVPIHPSGQTKNATVPTASAPGRK